MNNDRIYYTALRERKTLYAPDVSEDPRYVEANPQTRSELVIPLQTSHTLIGVLDLESPQQEAFNANEIRLLETFARRAATALENVQLWKRALQHNEELERRVNERTAALAQERTRLNTILDGMAEGVAFVEWDPPRASYVNEALCTLLDYSPSELVGRDMKTIHRMVNVHGAVQPHPMRTISDALKTKGFWRDERVMQRKDGSPFNANITITTVFDQQRQPTGFIALVRDISQEKRLQEQRERFITHASHELRTPLTNIKMRLYLLRRQPERQAEHLQVLERVAERMHALVEELLDISRFERNTLEMRRTRLVIQPIIKEVVDLQQPHAEKRGITLTMHLPDEPIRIDADSIRINQVVTNLVVNALNYTLAGGSIRVILTQEGDWAQLVVSDTGIGIASHLLQQIFEPFFRINMGTARGTGLGLPISREIVQLHGGEIFAQSEEGLGTNMIVRLPLASAEAS